MRSWITSRWDDLRTNFWFVPSIMVAGAIALSLLTIHLDRATAGENWVAALGWTFSRGPEGSRAVLSTVAGSMMTITSVAFSITIVALQLASSQFGPRLLRNFMRDRVNQAALGTFIATFTYCLLVLRTVNGTEEERFVPHASVTLGLLLSLASLGMLIYFFHHAAASIQAGNVIAAVSRELHQAIDRLFPECVGHGAPGEPSGAAAEALPPDFERASRPIGSEDSGYLQGIDIDRLMAISAEHDVIVRIARRPGKFFVAGGELARVWPGDRLNVSLADAVRGTFYFGAHRNLMQDIEFAIDQLVEVAVRALSPGINDPFTAITCVDRLGEALCQLATKEFPSPARYGEDGRLRLVIEVSTPAGIIDAAFHQIRQASRSNAAVTLRLLETIAIVVGRTRDPEFLAALVRHAELIHRGSQEGLPEAWDRREADERYQGVMVRTRAAESTS
jgi:uncharacterized membrane protein